DGAGSRETGTAPACGPLALGKLPDGLVQRIGRVGVVEEHASLPRGKRLGSVRERALEQRAAGRADRRALRAPAAEERAVQRVHVGIDHRADEAVVLARWKASRLMARVVQERVEIAELRRGRALLRNEKESPPPRPLTEAHPARVPRARHGEDERTD